MSSLSRLGPIVCLLSFSTLGCQSKPTLGELRTKNKATLDEARAAYAEMKRVVGAAPAPSPSAPCSRPGLVVVHGYDSAGAGDAVTETLDEMLLTSLDSVLGPDRLVTSDGPLRKVVTDALAPDDPVTLGMVIDPVSAQKPFDAASKVRYVLVVREQPSSADVFLFEHPKTALVCSFSVGAGGALGEEQKFIEDNRYGPHTAQPVVEKPSAGPPGLKAAFSQALFERFGLGQGRPARVEDPKVRARAEAVSKASLLRPPSCPRAAQTPRAAGLA